MCIAMQEQEGTKKNNKSIGSNILKLILFIHHKYSKADSTLFGRTQHSCSPAAVCYNAYCWGQPIGFLPLYYHAHSFKTTVTSRSSATPRGFMLICTSDSSVIY